MNDKIIKMLAYDGRVSVICADTTNLVEKARKIHDLSPVATSAFGRLLTIASIMGTSMKSQKHKLTIQVKGNGPLGTMLVTANNFPIVKGYVANPLVDIPLNEDGKLDISSAVGNIGYINVIKDIGLKEPYVGICPLVSGELAEDFAKYYETSEQKETAVGLGVLLNKEGVQTSGGYVISPMPDATSEDISNIEQNIFKAGAISKMLANNLTLEEIAKKITGDENAKVIEENIMPIYECDCSKENMSKHLIALGKEELEDIIKEDGKAELVCHFCSKKYQFSKEELIELSKEAKILKK